MTTAPRRKFVPRKQNPWPQEIEKFLGKKVTVSYMLGPVLHVKAGTLMAWEFNRMHCVLRTEDEKLLIRYPLEIRRERTHNNDVLHEYDTPAEEATNAGH